MPLTRSVVYSCPAANDVALILEFQTALHERQTPVTRAWCRASVFNEAGWIMAGCWRLPLRSPPVDLLPRAPSTFSQQVNWNVVYTVHQCLKCKFEGSGTTCSLRASDAQSGTHIT